jgi:hypothetical protein
VGFLPRDPITCVIASIYDVDEERDICLCEHGRYCVPCPTGRVSIRAPLVPRLVADSERYLGFSESPANPGETTDSPEASTTHQHAPPAGKEAGIRTNLLETPDTTFPQTELPVTAGETLSTIQRVCFYSRKGKRGRREVEYRHEWGALLVGRSRTF